MPALSPEPAVRGGGKLGGGVAGKPLLLYLPQRDIYFRLMEQVSFEGIARARAQLRPRDRKPVEVNVTVTALKQQMRWCWVFWEPDVAERTVPSSDDLLSADPAAI